MNQFKKYIISFVLTLVFCLGGFGVASLFTSKNQEPYTQEYINYLKLSDEEKKSLEIVPQKYPTVINSSNKEYVNELKQYSIVNQLGEYYNLRDEITLYTENQAQMGICWAYAGVKSLETFLALNYGEYWNFSEGFVAYANAKINDSEIDVGGNFLYFMQAVNTYGILSESFLPYEMMHSIKQNNMQYYSYLEQYADTTYNKTLEQVVIQVSKSGVEAAKAHIKQNGSLYIGLNSSTIRSGNNGYHVSNATKLSINHAVSIIGWDDNFSTLNFPEATRPTNNGAFLALNSYGPQFGNHSGVFYISYEDIFVTNGLMYGFKNKSTYDDEILKFEQIYSPTSTYNDEDMTNMFNLGDSVALDYTLKNNVETAPNVEVKIKKNGVNLTENFTINQTKTSNQTTVGISTTASLEAGTYTIEFKNNNKTYIRSFVIISGAELTSITTNAANPPSMFNTINGQTKTFSAGYFESTYGGYRKYIDVYIFVEKKYSQIESITINDRTLTYYPSQGKYNGTPTVTESNFLDMIVTTKNGVTETYKILVISNTTENLFYVNYNLNGGVNSPLNPTRFDTAIGTYLLTAPTKPNYTFDGWYAFEVRPESKITKLTSVNWGNMLLIANWKLMEVTYDLDATFRNDSGDIVEESQGLKYGDVVSLSSYFDYLDENNLTLKWFINSQHYSIYDSQTSINLQIQAGSFTVECQAIKDSVVIASQSKTFVAAKKNLSLTWQDATYVYNGQNQAPTASVTGLIGTDTYPLEYTFEFNNQVTENSISAGEYKATVTNLSSENYIIEENYEKTYSIQKAVLSLTWQNANYVYNSQIQAPTATVTGLIGTDTYPLQYVFESNNQVTSNSISAGEYKATITNLSNENYVIEENYEKTYTISPANLTITAKNVIAKYSDELLNLSQKYELTGTNYNREVHIKVLTNANPHKTGEYQITIQAVHANYNITTQTATYTVLPGNTYIYELPDGKKLTYHIDQGEEAPNLQEVYNPKFSIITSKEMTNENGTISYQITELSLVPIAAIASPVLLVVLFTIVSFIKKRKKWQY